MNILKTVTFDRLNRRKDKSCSLTFITSTEQTSEELKLMDELLDSSGVLYFKDSDNISKEEIDSLEATKIDVKPKGKSDSQLLRNVLYRIWEQEETDLTSDEHYHKTMLTIIQHFKDKLD